MSAAKTAVFAALYKSSLKRYTDKTTSVTSGEPEAQLGIAL